MNTIDLGGVKLAYDDRGQGPSVMFMHAYGLSLGMWDGQMSLASRCRLTRFDARGFGGSGTGDAVLTMARIADDAAALIEKLRLGPIVAVGCSMGGYASFAFAQKYPHLLRGLVLVDTRAAGDTAEGRASRGDLADRILREGARPGLDFFLPRVFGETTKASRPDVVAKFKEIFLATSPRGLADGLNGLAARPDMTAFLREIKAPTLVVCGEEDIITPRSDAEIMQRGIQGAELAMIPKSGHLPSMETPEAFTAVLAKFLERF